MSTHVSNSIRSFVQRYDRDSAYAIKEGTSPVRANVVSIARHAMSAIPGVALAAGILEPVIGEVMGYRADSMFGENKKGDFNDATHGWSFLLNIGIAVTKFADPVLMVLSAAPHVVGIAKDVFDLTAYGVASTIDGAASVFRAE